MRGEPWIYAREIQPSGRVGGIPSFFLKSLEAALRVQETDVSSSRRFLHGESECAGLPRFPIGFDGELHPELSAKTRIPQSVLFREALEDLFVKYADVLGDAKRTKAKK
jgi:phenylalanyl-tRNA synthetase beta subunit